MTKSDSLRAKASAPELIDRRHTEPEHTYRAANKPDETPRGIGHRGVFLHITLTLARSAFDAFPRVTLAASGAADRAAK